MRILVAGGHGFLGRHLCAHLAAEGGRNVDVIPLSRRDGFDLTSPATIHPIIRDLQPDTIFNCAAHGGSVHYVAEFAADVIHDNIQMALNLYRATHAECPAATIVNPLSNCSYPSDADIQREPEWWNGPVHPTVMSYGNSRRVIYVIAACYATQYRVRSVNFLVPNCYGPGDSTDPNRTHALNGMIIRMLMAQRAGEREFEIWGTGAPIREWGYVADMARVLHAGLSLDVDLTYPINIGQNHGYSIRESAEIIADEIGFEGRLVFNPIYADGAPRKVLDDTRFRELFPDFRFTDHREGIRSTVAYYRDAFWREP